MCTLALYFQVFPQYPLVVAANRDESLARPSAAPVQLWPAPWVYGGQDLHAGGTWLGINERSVVAAIRQARQTRTGAPAASSVSTLSNAPRQLRLYSLSRLNRRGSITPSTCSSPTPQPPMSSILSTTPCKSTASPRAFTS